MGLSVVGTFLMVAATLQIFTIGGLYFFMYYTDLLNYIGDSWMNFFIVYSTYFSFYLALVAAVLAFYSAFICDGRVAWAHFVLYSALFSLYAYETYRLYYLDLEKVEAKNLTLKQKEDYFTTLFWVYAICAICSFGCVAASCTMASRIQWCRDCYYVTIRVPRCQGCAPKCCMPGHVKKIQSQRSVF